jgi:hypothetical protein
MGEPKTTAHENCSLAVGIVMTPEPTPTLPASEEPPVAETAAYQDFDSPWKEAISAYFQPFMQLFFLPVHDWIDWNQPYEFLDAELQKLTGDSTMGKRYADRLVKVYLQEGSAVWLLIHIEVQCKADDQFNHRMFQYYYRIHDRHGEVEIISLAVVTNERDSSELGKYVAERDGYGERFTFRVHNLQDWRTRWNELRDRAATNPFAVVAMAQLVAHQRTRKPVRQARKRELIKLLYEHCYSREDVLQLLRFIDWMIRLPKDLELELQQELTTYEEQAHMSYVMSWERFAEERGEKRGEKRGEANALLILFQTKFGTPVPAVEQQIYEAPLDQVQHWLKRILTVDRPEDLFKTVS